MEPDTQSTVELNRAGQSALLLLQACPPAQSSSHGLEGLQGPGAAQCCLSSHYPWTCNFSSFRFLYPPWAVVPRLGEKERSSCYESVMEASQPYKDTLGPRAFWLSQAKSFFSPLIRHWQLCCSSFASPYAWTSLISPSAHSYKAQVWPQKSYFRWPTGPGSDASQGQQHHLKSVECAGRPYRSDHVLPLRRSYPCRGLAKLKSFSEIMSQAAKDFPGQPLNCPPTSPPAIMHPQQAPSNSSWISRWDVLVNPTESRLFTSISQMTSFESKRLRSLNVWPTAAVCDWWRRCCFRALPTSHLQPTPSRRSVPAWTNSLPCSPFRTLPTSHAFIPWMFTALNVCHASCWVQRVSPPAFEEATDVFRTTRRTCVKQQTVYLTNLFVG